MDGLPRTPALAGRLFSATFLSAGFLSAALALGQACAFAQSPPGAPSAGVQVQGAWARASVPGQMASGLFMTLTAAEPQTLVAVSTPMAGVAEVHQMRMDKDVMHMRPVPAGLTLPAGKAVVLRSGGYHVMLMDLKGPLLAGSMLPVVLHFKNARGQASQLALQVPVALSAPAGTPPGTPPGSAAHGH